MQTTLTWPDRANISSPHLLLDVRSPKEFQAAHVPGAISQALMNNAERHTIGCLYKKTGKSTAMAAGLELFAAKAAKFLQEIENLDLNSKKLLIYCQRGGLRSNLTVSWLEYALQRPVIQIKGGYKAYRQWVLHELDLLAQHPIIVLNGKTGCGKTEFLKEANKAGIPSIDLEGLACHRGSIFGGFAQSKPSPSQQQFENLIATAYQKVKTAPYILFELENAIGPVRVPAKLRQHLYKAPMVYLEKSLPQRIEAIKAEYCQNWQSQDDKHFLHCLTFMKKYLPQATYTAVITALKNQNWDYIISTLINYRYDKAYIKSLKKHQKQVLANFNLDKATGTKQALDFLHRLLEQTANRTTTKGEFRGDLSDSQTLLAQG